MRSRKNIKQEKDEGSRKIFSKIKGIYGGRRYLEKKRKFKKYRRIN